MGPVIGHRGAAAHAPENTLASLRAAVALGCRWVEFDVRLSRDGRPVLFHDDTLERTSDGAGAVAAFDLAALARLDAGTWFGDGRFAGERIPTLEAAIAALMELGLGANVEIKPDVGRETETGTVVAAAIKDIWPPSLPPPLISSFRPEALRAARDAAPGLRCALLVEQVPADWRVRLDALGCSDLHCAASALTAAAAAPVVAAGVPLRCFTVNDAATAARLFGLGVAAVFSDAPDRITSGT